VAQSNLAAIRKKVRLLTRRPSVNSISNADIDEYVNTFILYDLPYENKLENLKTNLIFYTIPNIDLYATESIGIGAPNNSLVNFKNAIIQIENPVYIDGYQVWLTEDQNLFYNSYPRVPTRKIIGTGDDVTTNYTGTLNPTPLLSGETIFSSFSLTNKRMAGADSKIQTGVSAFITPKGTLDFGCTGTINYITGAFDITFDAAPAAGENVYAAFVNYQPTRPQSVLFFNNQFLLRPVPDKAYKVEMEVYIKPSELLAAGSVPEIEQWWQWIAYGAAIKIFQDNSDDESAEQIRPEFDRQERLAMRTTIGQLSTNRVVTIYNLPNRLNSPFNYWGWGGPF
jgi:hypothetical protein